MDDWKRLWRVRRRHHHIDAVVRETAAGCELAFYFGDRRLLTRDFPDRPSANKEADAHLRDLQRAGWGTHW
jgi:hypothetical protein